MIGLYFPGADLSHVLRLYRLDVLKWITYVEDSTRLASTVAVSIPKWTVPESAVECIFGIGAIVQQGTVRGAARGDAQDELIGHGTGHRGASLVMIADVGKNRKDLTITPVVEEQILVHHLPLVIAAVKMYNETVSSTSTVGSDVIKTDSDEGSRMRHGDSNRTTKGDGARRATCSSKFKASSRKQKRSQ